MSPLGFCYFSQRCKMTRGLGFERVVSASVGRRQRFKPASRTHQEEPGCGRLISVFKIDSLRVLFFLRSDICFWDCVARSGPWGRILWRVLSGAPNCFYCGCAEWLAELWRLFFSQFSFEVFARPGEGGPCNVGWWGRGCEAKCWLLSKGLSLAVVGDGGGRPR